MAKGYRPVDRDQVFLLPPSMMDWLPSDHLVWFVIEVVRRLDTAAFHAGARLGGVGRRGYDPQMLLTLFVYAMAVGVRSSRQIERLCGTDVAFRIICANDVPDHTVLARFRQSHEQALADLLTETLTLAAELGFVRVGVVALDGTKITANASKEANRTEAGLRAIAERHLAEAADADAAEDALFGADRRGDELPEKLRDRTGRGQRISEALAVIEQRKAAAACAAAADDAAAQAYLARVSDPQAPPGGQPPKGADRVAAAKARWERERARAQATIEGWNAKAAQAAARGHKMPGSVPAPAEENFRVRRARASYDQARAAAQANQASPGGEPSNPSPTTSDQADEPKANLTDPDSRLLSTRNGFIQGYNCQTGVSDDQFILYANATQDANDYHQFTPILNGIHDTTATLIDHTGRDNLTIGTVLADAGYDSNTNLEADGPDRLIANKKRHHHRQHATHHPTTGDPPPDATARQAMDHQLRTQHGHNLYTRRSPLAEAPNGWLKDRRNLRQFLRRGQTAANSELNFACAVTNLLRLHSHGITPTQLPPTTS